MSAMTSQITIVSIVCWTFCSGADQRKYQSYASPVTGGSPHKRASNAENVSIWWRHHDTHWLCGNQINDSVLEERWRRLAPNRPISQIPHCICTISHNLSFRRETCSFCSEWWIVECGISVLWDLWNRSIFWSAFINYALLDGTKHYLYQYCLIEGI